MCPTEMRYFGKSTNMRRPYPDGGEVNSQRRLLPNRELWNVFSLLWFDTVGKNIVKIQCVAVYNNNIQICYLELSLFASPFSLFTLILTSTVVSLVLTVFI